MNLEAMSLGVHVKAATATQTDTTQMFDLTIDGDMQDASDERGKVLADREKIILERKLLTIMKESLGSKSSISTQSSSP